jgi:hypothetical protein
MSSLRRSQNRHRSAIARVRRHRSEIDIEDDATLVQRFGCDIPAIYIGRKKAAKYRVNLQQFLASCRTPAKN